MGWIGVDFDGTLAMYDYWRGIHHTGEPIPLMVERVKDWISSGIEVKVFTARLDDGNREFAVRIIQEWCLKHIGQELPVTNVKTMSMIELWDDKAVRVEKNTGKRVCY